MDMTDNSGSSWEIKNLKPEERAKLEEYFKGNFVHVGPKSYFLGEGYKVIASEIFNLQLEPSDVFVLGFPRSGTTWTQEIVWLLENNMDIEKARTVTTIERVPFLEILMLYSEERQKRLREENSDNKDFLMLLENVVKSPSERLARLPSPRIVKSHLPLSLLPHTLLDTARVVYIARDPRDVAVSYYHFLENMFKRDIDFKVFWEFFIKSAVILTPYFENVKEAWAKRHHPRVLFLFYEELSKDLPTVLRRVALFLNKKVTEDQLVQLCDYLSFNNLKKTKTFNDPFVRKLLSWKNPGNMFVRKGKVGGWSEYFDEEMAQKAKEWIADNLSGTDLSFPS